MYDYSTNLNDDYRYLYVNELSNDDNLMASAKQFLAGGLQAAGVNGYFTGGETADDDVTFVEDCGEQGGFDKIFVRSVSC